MRTYPILTIIFKIFLQGAIAGLTLFSCREKLSEKKEKIQVVVTTGMIRDAVLNIAEDRVHVTALMGPGVDPHLYKATQGDLTELRKADLILYNGLRLEGKMTDIFENLNKTKPVRAVSEKIAQRKLTLLQGAHRMYDPHIWFDVSLWEEAVKHTAEILAEQDSKNALAYQKNLATYLQKLDRLHQYVKEKIAQIPKDRRVLVTAHDAFGYFGKVYDIEVRGLQGISTVSEFGLKDITDLVDFIIQRNIKAVFTETSVSPKAIEAVATACKARGHEITIGEGLFSDAMGKEGTPEGTYIGMVTHNVNTIVNALK